MPDGATAALVSGLREMIASGRLIETDIPDDFEWLVSLLEIFPEEDNDAE